MSERVAMESPFQVCVFITAVPITSPFQVVLDVHESPSLSVWDPKIFAQGRSHPTFLSVSASHGACRHMLEPVRPEAVLSDMSLCLPTFFSHFWIVNKTSLSLSLLSDRFHKGREASQQGERVLEGRKKIHETTACRVRLWRGTG